MHTYKMFIAAAIALSFLVSQPVHAKDDAFAAGSTLVLPAPDVAKLRQEDERSKGPFRYGTIISVDDFGISGKAVRNWTQDANGDWTWRLDIASPGARTLDFHFSTLKLPLGATLAIIGEGKGNVRMIDASQLSAQSYTSPYITGERATLVLFVPRDQRGAVALSLASVTHGYRGLVDEAKNASKSGSCNVDVACSAGNGWQDQMASVAKYTFSEGGSGYYCTGTLVANTANSITPYFLTAHHCVRSNKIAKTLVVYWNYQSEECRYPGSVLSGTPLSPSISSHTQSGSVVRATNEGTDFTLLELSTSVPAGATPYFSGWSRSTTAATSARGIHHSDGDEKRFSTDNNALTLIGDTIPNSHWLVGNWEGGTTEEGASGSGLWDQNKRLVGQLDGGDAACGNTLPDAYGRFSMSWNRGTTDSTRLSNWLDPGNTGAVTKDGYRLGGYFQNVTDAAITDNTTIESTLSVSGRTGNAPTKLRVNLRILHTDIRNLKVDLVAPNGAVFVLHNRTGPTTSNSFRWNLYKTYEVNASASVANGTWRLRVNDNVVRDAGFIDAFGLQF